MAINEAWHHFLAFNVGQLSTKVLQLLDHDRVEAIWRLLNSRYLASGNKDTAKTNMLWRIQIAIQQQLKHRAVAWRRPRSLNERDVA
eukprot:CAMPEP_0179438540 /NCGR_PEP_ID=MMETSP0799-20121207/22262_1 /TAXON_ID=46947 /ORGANISM="Geminigera cryophila, Strain CCMP2564" /LENGTH=86 /DNA_ID=CAMNT_0021220237 /DNA_START=1222 /DNA_END=1478 /DNA_ORIENTATION=+